MRGLKKTSAASGWTKCGSLPSGITVKYQTYGLIANDTDDITEGYASMQVRINTSEEIEVYSPKAGKNTWGAVTFPCDIT